MKKLYLAVLLFTLQSFISAQSWEWQWQNPKPVGNNLYDIHALSSTRIIAFGAAGLVLLSTDAGETWQRSFPDASRREILGSYFINSTTGIIVGGTSSFGSLIMKTTDGGSTWVSKNPVTTNVLWDVEFYDASNGIACGASGTIVKTTDGGETWTVAAAAGTGTLYKVSIVSSTVVFVGSSNSSSAYLFKSTNFGTSFTSATPAQITSTVYGMYVLDASNYWVTTSSNGIVATTNGGTNWTVQQANTNPMYDVKFSSPTTGIAIDSKGYVWSTNNSGTAWTSSLLPITTTFGSTTIATREIDLTSGNYFIVGDGGNIFKSTNTGSSWIDKGSAITQQQLRKIVFTDDNIGYTGECPSSGNSNLLKTTDGGQTWTVLYTIPNPIYSISMPTSTTWYIGCSNNTIYKTTDAGVTFSPLSNFPSGFTALTYYAMAFADASVGYVGGGSSAKVMKTTDGGSSWTDISTAAGFTGTIYEIALIDANTFYLSGIGARLAKTTNGGTSFTAQSTGLTGTFFTVKFKDALTGFVGSTNLQVARTTDGGGSWTFLSLPSNPPATNASMWAFAISGSNVWTSTVNGDILYSTNNGTSWTIAKKPANSVIYSYAVSNNNMWGCGPNGDIIKGYVSPFTLTLNLSALLEAMYVAGGTAMTTTPSITVELHDASTLAVVESKTGTLSTAGIGSFTFFSASNGTPYYIVVKSPTTIETWSATTHSFTAGALSYDFTSGVSKAYTDGSMDPMAVHGGKACFYSGDVNQDGQVTSDDFTGVDNDNSNFDYHIANDVNGDGQVTSDDFTWIDNNNTNFVTRQVPAGAPSHLVKHVKSSVQKNTSIKK
jgi:photosystem II stability/assembly factor-like uncharacterized protein